MIKNIEYGYKKNKGNYESEEMKVSAAVEEGQSPEQVARECISFVKKALDGSLSAPTTVAVTSAVQTEMKIEEPKAKTVSKPKEVIKETPKADAEVKVEKPKTEEKPKETKKAPETKLAKRISKTTEYDRNLDTHKALLAQFLDTKYPEWRKSDNLKKAANASKALVGTAFLDEKGDMLDSFKEAFSKAMEA